MNALDLTIAVMRQHAHDQRMVVVRRACEHVAAMRSAMLEPWWGWTAYLALAITAQRIGKALP